MAGRSFFNWALAADLPRPPWLPSALVAKSPGREPKEPALRPLAPSAIRQTRRRAGRAGAARGPMARARPDFGMEQSEFAPPGLATGAGGRAAARGKRARSHRAAGSCGQQAAAALTGWAGREERGNLGQCATLCKASARHTKVQPSSAAQAPGLGCGQHSHTPLGFLTWQVSARTCGGLAVVPARGRRSRALRAAELEWTECVAGPLAPMRRECPNCGARRGGSAGNASLSGRGRAGDGQGRKTTKRHSQGQCSSSRSTTLRSSAASSPVL